VSADGLLVLDASVGVKWFRPEAGSDGALALLDSALRGDSRLAAPTHFVHEVLSVVQRRYETADILPAWGLMQDARLDVVPLTDEVVREAAVQCDRLGCSFYDALAPAVASILGATLVSADARAHGAYPGVRLIG
jgi:predicted nucleic acid-binding protein